MERQILSKEYSAWKQITNDFQIGDIIEAKKEVGLSVQIGDRFIIHSFNYLGHGGILLSGNFSYLHYDYPNLRENFKVVGYVEFIKDEKETNKTKKV